VTTKKRYFELSRAGRRRMLVASVLRSAASASLLVVLYYALPLNRPLGLGTLLVFGSGLLVFVGVAIWQVRAIVLSEAPGDPGHHDRRHPAARAVRVRVQRDRLQPTGQL
jgi:hypothetical protein